MITLRRFRELLGFALLQTGFWFVISFWTLGGASRIRLGVFGGQPWIELLTTPLNMALVAALLTPAIVAVVQYAPVAAPHRLRNLALLAAVVPVCATLHSLTMAATHAGVAPEHRNEFWRRFWIIKFIPCEDAGSPVIPAGSRPRARRNQSRSSVRSCRCNQRSRVFARDKLKTEN